MTIRFSFLTIISITLILAATGCSGIKVSQDFKPSTNFSVLKTYAWKDKEQKKTGDVRVDNPLMNDRIRNAADRHLVENGYVKSNDKTADFYITYQYVIRSKIKSSPSGSSVGFGFGTYGKRGAVGINTSTEISEYDEGMIVFDFIEPGSDALLWRGKSTSRVNTHASPEKLTKQINGAVNKILDQFPPKTK